MRKTLIGRKAGDSDQEKKSTTSRSTFSLGIPFRKKKEASPEKSRTFTSERRRSDDSKLNNSSSMDSEKRRLSFSEQQKNDKRQFGLIMDHENLVSKENFKLTDDNMLMPGTADEYNEDLLLHKGYLVKEGGNIHNWKRRYFKLFTTRIEYYKDEDQTKAIKSFPITKSTQVGEAPEKGSSKPNTFKVVTADRTLFLSASNREQMFDWIKKITTAARSIHLVKPKLMSPFLHLQKVPLLKKSAPTFKDYLNSSVEKKKKVKSISALSTTPFEQLTSTFTLNEKETRKTLDEFIKLFFEQQNEINIQSSLVKKSYTNMFTQIKSCSNSSNFDYVLKGTCQYEKPQPFIGGFPIFLKGTYYIVVNSDHDIYWIGFKSSILRKETSILADLNDAKRVTYKATQQGKDESFHISFEFDQLHQTKEKRSFSSMSNIQTNKLEFRFSDRNLWSYIIFQLTRLKVSVVEGETQFMSDIPDEEPNFAERSRAKSSAALPSLLTETKQETKTDVPSVQNIEPTPLKEEKPFESDDESETSNTDSDSLMENEKDDEPLTENDELTVIEKSEKISTPIPVEADSIYSKKAKKKENIIFDALHNIKRLEGCAQDEFTSVFSQIYYSQFISKFSSRGPVGDFIVFADERVIDKMFSSFLKDKENSLLATGMLYLTNHFLWFDSIDGTGGKPQTYQWMIHLKDIISIKINLSVYIIKLVLNQKQTLYISLTGEEFNTESLKHEFGFNDLVTLDINAVTSMREKRFLSSLRVVYCLVNKIQFAYNLDRQVFHYDENLIASIGKEETDDWLDTDDSETNSDTSVELSLLKVGSVRETMITNYFERNQQEDSPTVIVHSETDFDDTTFDGENDDNQEEYFDLQSFEVELVKKFKNKKVTIMARQNVVDDGKIIHVKDNNEKTVAEIRIDKFTNITLIGKNGFALTHLKRNKKETKKDIETLKFECKSSASDVVNYFSEFISGAHEEI